MKLSEKIQEALREQQEINLSDPAVQKRLAAQWGYVPADAQPAPSFADAYQGAMEDVAIWKRRALKAEDLNRKFVAEINGMGGEREAALMAKLEAAEKERDTLRAKIEAMERQVPVAWCATDETGTVIEALGMNQSRRFDTALYLAPGAQPAPIIPDTHNDMVVGLDYQGAMSCARQRAKKEAGLLYPEGDARKEEKERELASEYYRQYTTPNPEAKP